MCQRPTGSTRTDTLFPDATPFRADSVAQGFRMIDTPSPNFDERKLPVSMLVLHYTGMADAASAIEWMANPASKVSAHYCVTEEGQVVKMVDEDKRAWH